MSQYSPQVLCIQETNFKNSYSHPIKGYRCFYRNRTNVEKASGGVAIYIKDDFDAIQIPVNSNLEVTAVSLQYFQMKVSIINLYIPRNVDFTRENLQNILRQVPGPKIFVGDFNSDNVIWGSKTTDRRGREVEEFIDQNNLVLLNNGEGTRLNPITGEFSSIDLTFCDAAIGADLFWSPYPYPYGSDHLPLNITHINDNPPDNTHGALDRWNLKNADWQNFSLWLEENLPKFEPSSDVDHLSDTLSSFLIQSANLHIKKVTLPNKRPPIPWWSSECKKAIDASKKAFYRLKRHNTTENLLEFKKLRARSRYIVKKSKKESWAEFVSSLSSSSSSSNVWEKIRKIKGKNVSRSVNTIKRNDTLITSSQEIVEAFAEEYARISSNENYSPEFLNYKTTAEHNINSQTNTTANLYSHDHPLNIPFSMAELEDALSSCNESSAGPDNIPYSFLKHLPKNASSFLLSLYNKVYTSQQFPKTWSQATIIPILKSDKPRHDISSYRPISLTCAVCKLLEKMISRRLMWHLEKNRFLTECQSGFQKHKSAIDNVIHLESEIHEAFATQQKVLAVFFDLEKAYDLTWRHKIVQQLLTWGITGNITAFIQNFLKNRSIKVKINGISSNTKTLQNGIPQGSVLSTTLFLIAINDIVSTIRQPVVASLYADDLVIYVRGKNAGTLETLIQQTINSIETWTTISGFKLSSEKTKYIMFSKKKQPVSPLITLKGNAITRTDSIKFLGVIFDQQLNWREHFHYLRKCCTVGMNLLKTLAHHHWGADTNCLLTIYRSIIRARIDYALAAHIASKRSYFKGIETIENKALRIALGAFPTTPADGLHCLANELPIHDRADLSTLSFGCKILATPNNINFSNSSSVRFKGIYDQNPNVIPPLYERQNRILNKISYTLPPILPFQSSNIAPWILPPITLNLDLTKHNKSDTPPVLIRNEFNLIMSEFTNSTIIYTDASLNHSENTVGAAVVTPSTVFKYHLPKGTSVYTGELMAIYKALLYIANLQSSISVVCTDSLSSLQSISQLFADNALVQLIQQTLYQLQTYKKKVTLVFVPSHTGIPGNERADAAAREAASPENPDCSFVNIAIHSDVVSYARNQIKRLWQEKWTTSDSRLKNIKKSVSGLLSLPPNRWTQVKISRLRLGHSRLTHSFLLSREDPPLCEHCHVRLTVEHIMSECQQYTAQREECGVSLCLAESLGSDSHRLKATVEFLKATDLISKI